MNALQRRIKNLVARYGETFTVGGAGRLGLFSTLTTGQASAYLTDAESGSSGRPMRCVLTAYDDVTAEGNTVVWDGLSLAVKRLVRVRFRGSTVGRLLILG